MKCVRCGHDSKYKDRTGRRCPGCRKEFAFEPKAGDLVTDAAFQSAIDAVSAKGRLRWGVEHLYYEICRRRRLRFKPIGYAVAFVIAGVAGVAGFIIAWPVLAIVGWAGLVRYWRTRSQRVAVPRASFDAMWSRWRQAHGAPKGVIVRESDPRRPRAAEPDLGDYSFDRAVICDRARTVDLLLANNFHFENNCAVLSIGGYPERPFETVRAMLKRNPRLQVFALHDASAAGCKLATRLATDPAWFKDQVSVTDVGLRPSHARPFSGLLIPSEAGAVAPGDGLTAAEAKWLARDTLELAAIRPEQVLKRLFRAINRKRDDDEDRDADENRGDATTGQTTVLEDRDSFGADAADSDEGPDSFG